ncbi:MAG: hypothetical protein RL595_828 [Planctomycetota bacterium]|jgi:ABC-type phosphate/phosphonate transport system substrate-binding protein
MRKKFSLYLIAFLGMLVVSNIHLKAAEKNKTLKIGMVKTIFKDTPDSLLQLLMKPFRSVMESQTGFAGDLVMIPNHKSLSKQLIDGDASVGVYHGFEFAWAKLKNPDLQPMMLAVNSKAPLVAYLVVSKDSKVAKVEELKGKKLALPRGNREHCRMFLEHRILPANSKANDYFAKVQQNMDLEDAFDGLGDGDYQAVLADSTAWEAYKTQKPGRADKLVAVMVSETFVPAVIGYNPKKLDKEAFEGFKNGMLSASNNPSSKRLLEFVKITSFETIPVNFQEQLNDSVRNYPPPSENVMD